MPINFPNSPSPNQQYTYDNKTWEWNGIYWEVYSALTSYVTYTTFNSYTATTQPLILNSLTGGTYSGGTLYLTNNSGGTITITGFSTSSSGGTISGNYLPLSGGTVTGGTIFQSGLTANTISATTYYNYPDTYVTGFSSTNDVITLSQNRTDSYSSFTVTLSGLTGTSQQIAYYNASGNLTGDTNFTRLDETNSYTTTINTVNFSNINEHQDTVYDFSRVRDRVFNDDTSLVGVTRLESQSFISTISDNFHNTVSGLEILESSGSFTYQDSGGTYCGFFYNSTNPGWSIVRSGNQYDYNLPQSAYVVGSVLTGVSGNGNLTWVVPTTTSFTGGTVTGSTNFTGGLTANTISATTYQNVNAVTGGTYNNGTITLMGTGIISTEITGLTTNAGSGLYLFYNY